MTPAPGPDAPADAIPSESGAAQSSGSAGYILCAAALTAGLYFLAMRNYLAFHVLAEMFSIVVAAALFLLVWHSRRFAPNSPLLGLGVAFFFSGVIDLVHTLAYKGMGVFQLADPANVATQLWIAARWLESLSLLAFSWRRGAAVRPEYLLWGYAAATATLLWTILGAQIFPDCFVEGLGLTPFKIGSEYAICMILTGSLVVLTRNGQDLDPGVRRLLSAGILAAIVSELAFTFYVSVYGLSNFIGHLFKIASFLLVYLALVRTSLTRPYETLFRELTSARRALQREVAVLDTILEATAEAVLAADENGTVLHVNERFRELWGAPRNPIETGGIDRVLPFVLGRLKHPHAVEARLASLDGSEEEELPGLETDDGRVIEGYSSPLVQAGQAAGRVWSFRDVTERRRVEHALRESEERLRLFIEHAPAALAMFDREMRYLSVSRRWIADYQLGERELIGVSHYEIFPEIPETWRSVHRRALDGEVVRAEADRFERADGSVQWLRWEVRPWRGQAADVAGIVIFSEDVTPRKQAEEALRRLNETLEQRVAERTRLAEDRARQLQALAVELTEVEERERRRVADLLHNDLQQVLAAARMQVEAASQGMASDLMLANAEQLLSEAISRARRLSNEICPPVLHHSSLFATMQWLAERMMEQFGLRVELEIDSTQACENLSLKIFLFRAAQELLFNVVKHAEVNTARLGLSRQNGNFLLTVSDQGKGFSPARLNSTTAMAGFGLLSLRERTRYIGGSLAIESEPGRGSRFTVSVPTPAAGFDAKIEGQGHPYGP